MVRLVFLEDISRVVNSVHARHEHAERRHLSLTAALQVLGGLDHDVAERVVVEVRHVYAFYGVEPGLYDIAGRHGFGIGTLADCREILGQVLSRGRGKKVRLLAVHRVQNGLDHGFAEFFMRFVMDIEVHFFQYVLREEQPAVLPGSAVELHVFVDGRRGRKVDYAGAVPFVHAVVRRLLERGVAFRVQDDDFAVHPGKVFAEIRFENGLDLFLEHEPMTDPQALERLSFLLLFQKVPVNDARLDQCLSETASHVEKTAVVLYRRDNGVNLVNSEFEIELADIGPNHIGQSGDKF